MQCSLRATCHISHRLRGRRCSPPGLSYWEASDGQQGHTEALEESTPVSSPGLWTGALAWKLGSAMSLKQKCSCTPSTPLLNSPRASPRTKAVLQPAISRATAWHGWSQPWGAAQPRALARLLQCCPSPPTQQHPHGRQAPGKCTTGPWGHSLTSCSQRCSVWVPSLPTHLLPVLATEQHSSPGNSWPPIGGRGQGGQGPWPPPHLHHASNTTAAATVSVALSQACSQAL